MLRYLTMDGRIDVAWPCRVVEDRDDLVALFVAAGAIYRADPKQLAAQKLAGEKRPAPVTDVPWRHDMLRLMFPGAGHSVWLFWEGEGASRRLLRYFVNLEDPFWRTSIGFETRDHTLDIVVTPELECRWRDEEDFDNHVALGLYPPELAASARAEGQRVIDAIANGTHPCLNGWAQWAPDPSWTIPALPPIWNRTDAGS
ncbi:MAG TPA: DUF402 domain-containing protein [Vicinamibacterales bacterium]|nr:DUF402 domain-containing protein [Vicinamibacterales bacterium]